MTVEELSDGVSKLIGTKLEDEDGGYCAKTCDKSNTERRISDTFYELRKLSSDCIELLRYENGRYDLCVEIDTAVPVNKALAALSEITSHQSLMPLCWAISCKDGECISVVDSASTTSLSI